MYAAAIGSWTTSDEKCLISAANHASTRLDFQQDVEAVVRRMEERVGEPRCVLAAHDADLETLVSRLRERASLLTVPVIAVVPHASDALYRGAFACGADDALVAGDRGGITRRLANLLESKQGSTVPSQGMALVASADIGMRRVLGKSLRRAGFDVTYATEARELSTLARTLHGLSLVVASEDFPPLGAEAAIRFARTAACKPNLPALTVPADCDRGASAGQSPRFDADGSLLCFAEEITRGGAVELRASARLRHAAICGFRPSGVLHPTYGLTHNVSREGLFVRTLDAPKPGTEVWIELRAPESSEMVHLRGQVVWRREPGSVGATPFGFGMRLVAEACPVRDLRLFERGYGELAARVGAS